MSYLVDILRSRKFIEVLTMLKNFRTSRLHLPEALQMEHHVTIPADSLLKKKSWGAKLCNMKPFFTNWSSFGKTGRRNGHLTCLRYEHTNWMHNHLVARNSCVCPFCCLSIPLPKHHVFVGCQTIFCCLALQTFSYHIYTLSVLSVLQLNLLYKIIVV